MQSLSLQKAKPPELRKQSLCQCPEGKAYALKAKPMPAEGKPPELHVMNHPVTSRFIPFQRFTVFSVSPFQTPISLKRNETTKAKQIPAPGKHMQAKPSEKC